eukprot:7296481-Pyramimonas_sp.AAC.1
MRSEIGTPPDYLSSMFAFGAPARNYCARPHLELVAQVQRVKHVRINVFAVGEHSQNRLQYRRPRKTYCSIAGLQYRGPPAPVDINRTVGVAASLTVGLARPRRSRCAKIQRADTATAGAPDEGGDPAKPYRQGHHGPARTALQGHTRERDEGDDDRDDEDGVRCEMCSE